MDTQTAVWILVLIVVVVGISHVYKLLRKPQITADKTLQEQLNKLADERRKLHEKLLEKPVDTGDPKRDLLDRIYPNPHD